MDVEEYLKFFYPFFDTDGDPRKVEPAQIAVALQISSRHIPECLSDDEKAEAQAHYAAYLLGAVVKNKPNSGNDIAVGEAGAIKAIKEGDAEYQYYQPTGIVADAGFAGGLQTAYDRYQELASKCVIRLTTVRR